MASQDPLSQSLAALCSQFFVGDGTLQDTLHRVGLYAQQAVPAAAMTGMTMLVDGRPTAAVFTHEAAPEIDSAQYETGVGPRLDSFRYGTGAGRGRPRQRPGLLGRPATQPQPGHGHAGRHRAGKGILMGAQRRTADEALQILVRASQRENRKLREIAENIVGWAQTGGSE